MQIARITRRFHLPRGIHLYIDRPTRSRLQRSTAGMLLKGTNNSARRARVEIEWKSKHAPSGWNSTKLFNEVIIAVSLHARMFSILDSDRSSMTDRFLLVNGEICKFFFKDCINREFRQFCVSELMDLHLWFDWDTCKESAAKMDDWIELILNFKVKTFFFNYITFITKVKLFQGT